MRRFFQTAFLVLLAACGGGAETSGEAIVVYASEDDPAGLPALFDRFTADTGVAVAVSWGSSSVNAAAVIGKRGAAADVLITPNVSDVWRAAERGALRPLRGDALASVHQQLKDPDALWVSLNSRPIVIAVSPQHEGSIADGHGTLSGPMCLSSLDNSVNQAWIAMLIEDLGLRPAEHTVRRYLMNLSAPPFESEAALVAALENGDCAVGILSRSANTAGLESRDLGPGYIDVSAMGIGRHANNPAEAQQLIDWLIRNTPPGEPAAPNSKNVGLIGWHNDEVMLLAERVGYR